MEKKVAWIVGSSSGIGAAIAMHYAQLNYHLILSGRDRSKLELIQKKCLGAGARAEIILLDYEKNEELPKCSTEAWRCFGQIDLLFLCAGVSQRSYIKDTNMIVYRKLMEVNYFGTITIANQIVAEMVKRKSGHIIVVSSVAGLIGTALRSGYAASKSALAIYFECMSAEVISDNVSITMAYPGYIQTEITLHSLTGDGTPYNKIDKGIKHGMTAKQCAASIIKAVNRKQFEVVVAQPREKIAVLLKRLFPSLLRKIVRSQKPLD